MALFSFIERWNLSPREQRLVRAFVVVAIAFVAKNVAQVRYVRTDRKGGAEVQSHWVATVEFRYVSQPAGEEARGVNPLGFQVTNYRNDPEAVVEITKP